MSNEPSEATLFIPLENGTELDGLSSVEGADRFQDHDLKEVRVSTVRLDEMDLPPVGFMKIDVEGHELAVLEGAYHLIERDAPTIILEAEERHRAGTVRACSTFLHERGYEGFFVLDREILNIADFDISKHQNMDNVAFSARILGRTYINNFLFLKNLCVLKDLKKWIGQ